MPNIGAITHDQHTDKNVEFDKEPDACPICHAFIRPIRMTSAVYIDRTGNQRLDVAYRCSREQCGAMFVARYREPNGTGEPMRYTASVPRTPEEANFPKEVTDISPAFLKIYNQALAAEGNDLDEIAGIGFRKSLEFLIKDFCVSRHPDEEDAIKSSLLGNVIKGYVDDARVKAMAERAAWLGNDETHYVKKWEGKDITDLKTLIRVSANWIENVLLTERYTAEMPAPEKPKKAGR